MQQSRLPLLKPVLMAILLVGIAFGCTKSGTNNITIDPSLQNFVLIPATNSFMMGSSATEVGRVSDEQAHKVNLSSFYMSKYELTIGEFKAFLASKDTMYLPAGQRNIASYYNKDWSEADKHPITSVSWNAAVRYCNFRSKQAMLDTCYIFNPDGSINNCDFTKKGYRLPTEAEWEYACRAGSSKPFSGTDSITTAQANYNGKYPYDVRANGFGNNPTGVSLNKTAPVGSYPANAFGLYDMHGNIVDWCWDWYNETYYPTDGSVQNNPTGPTTGLLRVFRGGSWSYGAVALRSAWRKGNVPSSRYYDLGFRLAKTM